MSMTDPIADLITRIRNAHRMKKQVVHCRFSIIGNAILDVLKQEGYIRGYKTQELRPGISESIVELKYYEGEAVIHEISRSSKPGRRHYVSVKELGRARNGLGVLILSTSKGVLSDEKAAQLSVGGEVLCQVF